METTIISTRRYPARRVNGELTEPSGLLGYQVFAGNVKFSAFAGVDWQDNKLSPRDPSDTVSGSETDFIATADMETTGPKRLYLKLYGGYSIVNETYWAKGRIAYKFGASRRFKIGPEGAFFGNENFNSQQVGAFVSFPLAKRLDVTLAGGFNFVANDEFFERLETGIRNRLIWRPRRPHRWRVCERHAIYLVLVGCKGPLLFSCTFWRMSIYRSELISGLFHAGGRSDNHQSRAAHQDILAVGNAWALGHPFGS